MKVFLDTNIVIQIVRGQESGNHPSRLFEELKNQKGFSLYTSELVGSEAKKNLAKKLDLSPTLYDSIILPFVEELEDDFNAVSRLEKIKKISDAVISETAFKNKLDIFVTDDKHDFRFYFDQKIDGLLFLTFKGFFEHLTKKSASESKKPV